MRPTGRRLAAFVVIVCLQAVTSACSSRTPAAQGPVAPPAEPRQEPPIANPTPQPPAPPPASPPIRSETTSANDCALIAATGESVATVAVGDRIDRANAPRPSNDGERLLFRQLYETMVRVDCMGRVIPGLGESWRLDADGRTWIVTLRDNARFSDGTAVTPADVLASWTREASGDELRPQVSRLVQSVIPAGDRAVSITLQRPHADAPWALAHPDLAIAKTVADSPWPIGTRSARIASDGATQAAIAASIITVARDDLPPVRFLLVTGDPRDSLDREVDLLLTRDPATLEYAASLPQFQSIPLTWQRTHVLLAPGRSRTSPALTDDARRVLADDAVRGEARGAMAPFWWQMLPDCEVAHSSPREQASPVPRIVYDASDAVAHDLAERLVGLARASGPGATPFLDALLPDRPRRAYQRAVGLTGDSLARARRNGADAGYIVSLESRPLDPCRDLQTLVDGARWLDPETIVPLVDTRLHAIVRRGRSNVTAEWGGGLVLAETTLPR